MVIRLADGAHVRTPGLNRVAFKGDLRIDPAPRWNRTSDALLVPGLDRHGIRQLFQITIRASQPPITERNQATDGN